MSGRLKIVDLIDGEKKGVLFCCVANSARSQMAEGFARFLGPSSIDVHSAGARPARLSPFAVRVMNEVGIDISKQLSKGVEDIPMETVAVAVTLCEDERCPILPDEVQVIRAPLPDPAGILGSEAQVLESFRAVRDQIRELISALF